MGDARIETDRAESGQAGHALKPRVAWVDSVRGLALVLVMIFHTYEIAVDDTGIRLAAMDLIAGTFAPFRMPAMIFMSGMFVPRSLAKGAATYVGGKLRAIAYPYFIWSAIMILVIGAASFTVGRHFDMGLAWKIFYQPIEHLWFLAYLFIYFMLALAVRKVPPLVSAALLYAASWVPLGERWSEVSYLAVFFFAGIAAVKYGDRWEIATRSLLTSSTLLAVPLAAFILLAPTGVGTFHNQTLLLLSLAAITGSAGLMMRFGGLLALRPFRYFGRESLVFYLTHWPAAMGLSQVGESLKIPMIALFPAATLGAILISWGAAVLSKRTKAVRLFFKFP